MCYHTIFREVILSCFRIFSATLVFLIVSNSSVAQDNPILKRMEAFATAYNAQDARAISEFYILNGALFAPRNKPLVGRKPIEAHYAKAFKAGAKDLRFQIDEFKQAGPSTAIEIGQTRVKFGKQTILGRYLHVWVKTDGGWLISRDIYHVLGVGK